MGERILISGGGRLYRHGDDLPCCWKPAITVTVLDRFGEGDTVLAPCCRYDGFHPDQGRRARRSADEGAWSPKPWM